MHRYFGPCPSVSANSRSKTPEEILSDANVVEDVSELSNDESMGPAIPEDSSAFDEFEETPEEQDSAQIQQNKDGSIADISIGPEFDKNPALWPDLPTESLLTFLANNRKFEQNFENRRNFQETEAAIAKRFRALTIGLFYRSFHNREEKCERG